MFIRRLTIGSTEKLASELSSAKVNFYYSRYLTKFTKSIQLKLAKGDLKMKRFILVNFLFLVTFSSAALLAQTVKQDKGVFVEKKPGYYQDVIMKSIREFNSKPKKVKKIFQVDVSNYDLPTSVNQFTTFWHNKPISQGNTGTCWDFATTSFLESEIYRTTKKKVKLSEMFTAYWEYVEKAREFVKTRGKSLFAQGSEANAVTRMWKKYGIVPEKDFTGLKPGQKFHDHSKMFKEMYTYLQSVKKENAWNEELVLSTIKSILNNYLGTPPNSVNVNGKTYTPKQYLSDYLKLNPDDYIDVLSYKQAPYYKQVEYKVPDNWWHSKEYYNVPLNEFMAILKKAIKSGYTLSIGGDVSEPGKIAGKDVFVVPTFDIPSKYINEDARQFRFSNGSTTDDHGIHLVGYLNKDGQDWYVIKDSGSSSRDGKNKGYYFLSGDYVKLKIMDFMVHKDVMKSLLKKFK